ncbi:MAG: hypothetical protein AB1449_14315 [Chloroflexota bacterium]
MGDPAPTPPSPATQDRSLPSARANAIALGLGLPTLLALWGLYAWLWPGRRFAQVLADPLRAALLLVAVVAAIPIHEAIHALGWALLGRVSLRRVRFGLAARSFNLYAHLLDPIPARAYRWGAALPGIAEPRDVDRHYCACKDCGELALRNGPRAARSLPERSGGAARGTLPIHHTSGRGVAAEGEPMALTQMPKPKGHFVSPAILQRCRDFRHPLTPQEAKV